MVNSNLTIENHGEDTRRQSILAFRLAYYWIRTYIDIIMEYLCVKDYFPESNNKQLSQLSFVWIRTFWRYIDI